MLLTDWLSVALRGLSFLAMAQAAGALLFLVRGGARLGPALQPIRRHARRWIIAGLLLVPAQYLLEAGRMAGQVSGVLDTDLQRFVLGTPAAGTAGVRVAALALLAAALGMSRTRSVALVLSLAGIALLAISFPLTGHTRVAPERWLLAPMLALHVLVVCFWFGALRPLLLVARHESAATAARVVAGFSRAATLLVPALMVSGVIIAVWLLPGFDALASSYGRGLLAKTAAFAALMVLASLNKWRLAPLLASGGTAARQRFSRTVQAEWLIIAAVLLGTAALTMLTSP